MKKIIEQLDFVFATLTRTPIRIKKVHEKILPIIQLFSPQSEISGDEFRASILMGGDLEFETEEEISDVLNPILFLLPYMKTNLNLSIKGKNMSNGLDITKMVYLKVFKKFGLKIKMNFTRGINSRCTIFAQSTSKILQYRDSGREVTYSEIIALLISCNDSSMKKLSSEIKKENEEMKIYKQKVNFEELSVLFIAKGKINCFESFNPSNLNNLGENCVLAQKNFYKKINGLVDVKLSWIFLSLMAMGPDKMTEINIRFGKKDEMEILLLKEYIEKYFQTKIRSKKDKVSVTGINLKNNSIGFK